MRGNRRTERRVKYNDLKDSKLQVTDIFEHLEQLLTGVEIMVKLVSFDQKLHLSFHWPEGPELSSAYYYTRLSESS